MVSGQLHGVAALLQRKEPVYPLHRRWSERNGEKRSTRSAGSESLLRFTSCSVAVGCQRFRRPSPWRWREVGPPKRW